MTTTSASTPVPRRSMPAMPTRRSSRPPRTPTTRLCSTSSSGRVTTTRQLRTPASAPTCSRSPPPLAATTSRPASRCRCGTATVRPRSTCRSRSTSTVRPTQRCRCRSKASCISAAPTRRSPPPTIRSRRCCATCASRRCGMTSAPAARSRRLPGRPWAMCSSTARRPIASRSAGRPPARAPAVATSISR